MLLGMYVILYLYQFAYSWHLLLFVTYCRWNQMLINLVKRSFHTFMFMSVVTSFSGVYVREVFIGLEDT